MCKMNVECLCADCPNNDGKRCAAWQERTCSACSVREYNNCDSCSYFEEDGKSEL